MTLRTAYEQQLKALRQAANEPYGIIACLSNRELLDEINRLLKVLHCETWSLGELREEEIKLEKEKVCKG
jgi:hypothetical protein